MVDQIDWDGALTHRIGKVHEVGLFNLQRQPDGTLAAHRHAAGEAFHSATSPPAKRRSASSRDQLSRRSKPKTSSSRRSASGSSRRSPPARGCSCVVEQTRDGNGQRQRKRQRQRQGTVDERLAATASRTRAEPSIESAGRRRQDRNLAIQQSTPTATASSSSATCAGASSGSARSSSSRASPGSTRSSSSKSRSSTCRRAPSRASIYHRVMPNVTVVTPALPAVVEPRIPSCPRCSASGRPGDRRA